MTPGTSFRRRPESSAICASTRGRHLDYCESRSDEYIATGPIYASHTPTSRWSLFSISLNIPRAARVANSDRMYLCVSGILQGHKAIFFRSVDSEPAE